MTTATLALRHRDPPGFPGVVAQQLAAQQKGPDTHA